MFEFDYTLLVLAVSFLIFMQIMKSIFYSPMRQVKREREGYVEQNKALAEQALAEAELIAKQREDKISEARKQATVTVSEMTELAGQKRAKIISNAHEDARWILDNHKKQIHQQKEQAMEQLKEHVLEIAHSISTKVLGKEVPMSGISSDVVEKAMRNEN